MVEIRESLDFLNLRKILATVVSNPIYHTKNDIWDFGEFGMNLTQQDLSKITSTILSVWPPQSDHRKTAILSTSGLNISFVEIWKETADQLPYEVRPFSSLSDAEKWVTS